MKKKKWEKRRDEAMRRLLDDLQLEMTLNIFFLIKKKFLHNFQ